MIENTQHITISVNLDASSYRTDSSGDMPALAGIMRLAETIRALGMGCELSKDGTTLTVDYMEAEDARRIRYRHGGRPRAQARYVGELEEMWDDSERLAWLESHDVDEGRMALGGVSKRTYYRRVADLRESVRSREELLHRLRSVAKS